MPKKRFQCMLSEKALARLQDLAGAPDKRQVWLERFLTTPPDPSGNFLIVEQGNVKSEPSRNAAADPTDIENLPGAHGVWRKNEPSPEQAAVRSVLLGSLVAGAVKLDPEVEQGQNESSLTSTANRQAPSGYDSGDSSDAQAAKVPLSLIGDPVERDKRLSEMGNSQPLARKTVTPLPKPTRKK